MTKDAHEDWTKAECWAWKRIQAGEIADFNEKLGQEADPAKPEDWDERRTLRRQFLEVIIEPPWREHIHRGMESRWTGKAQSFHGTFGLIFLNQS